MSKGARSPSSKPRSGLSPFLRESILFSGSTGLEQGSRLLSNLAVAGIIGPAAWGAWYILNLVLRYGSLFHLGAVNGLNREVPAALGRGSEQEAARIQEAALGIVLLSLPVVILIVLVGNSLLPQPFPIRDVVSTLLLLAAHQLHGFGVTSLRARTQFTAISKIQAASAVIFPALCIPAALIWGLTGYLLSQVAVYLVLVLLIRSAHSGLFRVGLDLREGRRLIDIGFPIMLVGVTHTFFSTIDRWIVLAFLDAEALGHYSIAIMALGAVQLVPRVFSQQIYPRMAFDWAKNPDPKQLIRHGRRLAQYALIGAVLVAAPMALIAPWAIRTFLPAYTPGIGALLVTLLVPIVTVLGQGFGNILNIINQQVVYLAVILLGMVVNGVTSLLLVERLGLVGIASGTVAGYVAIGVSLMAFGPRILRRMASRSAQLAPADAKQGA